MRKLAQGVVAGIALIVCNIVAAGLVVGIGKGFERLVPSAAGDPLLWFCAALLGVAGSIYGLWSVTRA